MANCKWLKMCDSIGLRRFASMRDFLTYSFILIVTGEHDWPGRADSVPFRRSVLVRPPIVGSQIAGWQLLPTCRTGRSDHRGVCTLFIRPARVRLPLVCNFHLLHLHSFAEQTKVLSCFRPSAGVDLAEGTVQNLIDSVVAMNYRNPEFGAVPASSSQSRWRFGLEIDRMWCADSDASLPTAIGFAGPSWLTFPRPSKDRFVDCDRSVANGHTANSTGYLWVMDQFTRRSSGLAVHRGAVMGWALCRCSAAPFSGKGPAQISQFGP